MNVHYITGKIVHKGTFKHVMKSLKVCTPDLIYRFDHVTLTKTQSRHGNFITTQSQCILERQCTVFQTSNQSRSNLLQLSLHNTRKTNHYSRVSLDQVDKSNVSRSYLVIIIYFASTFTTRKIRELPFKYLGCSCC